MAEQPITAHFALKRLYSEFNGHATEITVDFLNGGIAS
jgi:hypothetical protein